MAMYMYNELNGLCCVCVCVCACMLARVDTPNTVDRELFTLKIIRVKKFRVDKFLRFVRSAKNF